MKYIKHIIFLSIVAVLALLPTGCINGELDGCPPGSFIASLNIRLVYSDTLDAASAEDVRRNATLFIFDTTGIFVNSYSINPVDTMVQTLSDVNLKPNNIYNFVVWHNIDVDDATYPYKYMVDSTAKTQAGNRFYLPDSEIDATRPFLPYFYGKNTNYEFTTDLSRVVQIPVYRQTNEINVKITGLNAAQVAGSVRYKFEIRDKQAEYSFDNDIIASNTDMFYRIEGVSPSSTDSTVAAKLHILKLSTAPEAPKPDLTVTMSGQTIFGAPDNISLVSLIQASFRQSHTDSLDFDRYHKFDIVIDLKGARGASFSVNDWGKIKPDGSDFEVVLEL
ncbi:FimB/Mfa2 family fimbrial subunit [Candidatus Symbiothrix dinenymphae]|uniref:FimB/Mfa2 family fimbrial subunit n=1 Tax=Candidatus Symbiothrix dinenymphae TaxID=467085 RepID=UPI0006C42B4D|nr:FimB/Mfa2 family fimbrial subunit [Candidatus Symbiothrix dinenymphae]GAP72030.1 hypothetical protein SAMD00024442_22_22 [Candidatus Symbiothrix dinenymphae]